MVEKCPHCRKKWTEHPGVLLLCERVVENDRLLGIREIVGGVELFKLKSIMGWASEFNDGIGKVGLKAEDVVMVDASGRICRTSSDVHEAFTQNKFPISVRRYR